MSVLSADTQTQVEDRLVKDGLVPAADLKKLKDAAKEKNLPFLAYLVEEGVINNEQLTKTTASITNVPYVNLSKAIIDPAVLALLPQEIAERYMAVPLGTMQHRLVVAMLDADNVHDNVLPVTLPIRSAPDPCPCDADTDNG